jgi:putative MATE family efflux protein
MTTEAAIAAPPSPLTRAERSELRREVIRQAWPVVLQNLLHTLMFYVDTYMISGLGKEAMAAMGVVGPITHTVTSILSVLSVGTVATVARAWGSGDPQKREREAAASLAVAVALGAVATAAGIFVLPAMATLFEVPDAPGVLGSAQSFLRIQGAVQLFYCVYLAATGIYRAAGRMAFPMLATLGANGLNVFLNWVFIYGHLGAPRMGVTGASLATAVSIAAECVLIGVALFLPGSPIRLGVPSFRALSRESVLRLVRVSLPAAAEPLLLQGGFLVYNKAITLLGTLPMAAHRAAITVESLTFMPGLGFAVAGSAVVGQFLGAGRPDKAEAGFRESARISTYLMSAIGVGFLFASAPLVRLFLRAPDDGPAVALAAACLAISAFEQPFMALSMSFGGALRGAGDTKSPVLVGVVGVWLVRVPLAWALAFPAGLGLTGIWITMVVDWAVRAALFSILWRRGRWKAIKL